jgi:hypothetical protein
MKAQSLQLLVQTGQLKKSLNDGTFLKQSREVRQATDDIRKHIAERRKLLEVAKKTELQDRYGQRAGSLAYHAQRLGRPAGGLVREAAGSALGLAASIGVPLSVAAVTARGFSGTSTYAKMDNEVERLSRHMASDLAPAMDWFTRQLNKINKASDRIRTGNGTLMDHVTANSPWAVGALGSIGGLAALSTQFRGLLAGGLSTAGSTIGQSAFGTAAGAALGRVPFGTLAKAGGLGYLAYETQDTLRNYNPYRNELDDPQMRETLEKRRREADQRTWAQRNFPNVSWAVGLSGGGPPGEVDEAKQRAKKGGVVVTAETGQKADMTDVYEELQSRFGKLTEAKDSDQTQAITENTKAVQENNDHLRAIRAKMGG